MKILYIIHDNKRGGAALSFLDMLKGVNERCEVVVLTPHRKGFIPDQLSALNIRHLSMYYSWWEISSELPLYIRLIYKIIYKWNVIAAYIISKRIRRMNIDIIHSNSSTISIGALISQYTGIPHVWHLREVGELSLNLTPISQKDNYFRIFGMGDSYYIAISEYVKAIYGEYVPKDRIWLVYNGISDSYNKEKTSQICELPIRFLISGNYSREKGQFDVAEAVNKLVNSGLTNFEVYMAGSGDFREVHDYISDNNLDKQIKILGMVEDVKQLRDTVDIEIVASKAEAFGRVTVEAMRSSNPVIGAISGATPELIKDGETGYLYDWGNVCQLADKMKLFIDNPQLVQIMGCKAYSWSKNRFTSKDNLESILALYRHILD